MKKGFTLAELLGVIAILGIIALITIPVIDRSLNQGREKLSKAQETQIKKACQDYYTKNLKELPQTTGTACKTVKELQEAGFLQLDVKNPKTGKDYSSSFNACVKRTYEKDSNGNVTKDYLEYDVCENNTECFEGE